MRDSLDRRERELAAAQVRERRIAAGLFVATCASVFVVQLVRTAPSDLSTAFEAGFGALAFTAGLMTILLAHELGHVAGAAGHGIPLSWPWFLPAPFLVGTFGAVMRLEHPPRDREGLIGMAAAGPVAGFVAACAVFALHAAVGAEAGAETLARPLVWRLPELFGVVVAAPSPAQPLGFAAWLGFLLTGMNLLPIGQLDGGHLAYGLWPRGARAIGLASGAVLLALGLWWPLWAGWVLVLYALGATSAAEVRSPGRPISRAAVAWAVVAWACGAASFMPMPS